MTKSSSLTILVLVYVDDVIIIRNCLAYIRKPISQLNLKFSLKQLGALDYFLGIKASHLPRGSLFTFSSKIYHRFVSKGSCGFS